MTDQRVSGPGSPAGPNRSSTLVSMSAALTRQVKQAGLNAPGSEQLSREAIRYGRLALAALGPADPRRGHVLFDVGNLLAIRRVAMTGETSDQDAAIETFEEFLSMPGRSRGDSEITWFWLGLLLMFRSMRLPAAAPGRPPDHRDIIRLMAGYEPGPGATADVARAATYLEELLSGEAAHPPLQRMAAGVHAMTRLMQATMSPGQQPPGFPEILGLIQSASRAMTPEDPGHPELVALHAWLKAEDVRLGDRDDPGDEALHALEQSAGGITPGHMLHAVLNLELGLTTAYRAQREGGGERLRRATEFTEQARAELADFPDHPMYEDSLRQLAGLLASSTAWDPEPGAIDKVGDLAQMLLRDRDPADTAGVAKDTYLLSMAQMLRAARSHRPADLAAAADSLHRALTLLPPDDAMAPTMLATFGALLNDRYQIRGALADAEAAQFMFGAADRILAAQPGQSRAGDRDLATSRGLRGVCRIALAWRTQDAGEMAMGQAEILEALEALPDGYAWRSRLISGLGMSKLMLGALRADYSSIQEGIAALAEAAAAGQVDAGSRAGLRAVGALALVMDGRLRGDAGALDRAAGELAAVAADRALAEAEQPAMLWALGLARLARHDLGGDSTWRDLGIASLEQAWDRIAADLGHPLAASLLWSLAHACQGRGGPGDREMAADAGLAALHAQVYDVLLQSDAAHSLTIARGAAEHAATVTRWLLADGRSEDAVLAAELGRGLVLNAATLGTRAADLLRQAGHAELAREWDQSSHLPVPPGSPGQPDAAAWSLVSSLLAAGEPPGDLRPRTVAALGGIPGIIAPTVPELTAALRAARADALAYLLPGDREEPGVVLILLADGSVTRIAADGLVAEPDGPALRYALAERARRHCAEEEAAAAEQEWRAELDAVTRWAWDAAAGRLLQVARDRRDAAGGVGLPRLILVPAGIMGVVPWHAAWTEEAPDGRRYACREAVFSYAASGRQLAASCSRPLRPAAADPVFVASPDSSAPGAMFLTNALRVLLYPRSKGYGNTGDPGDPQATPERVLAHVPGASTAGASLLQLSCHGFSEATPMASHLLLAGPEGDPAAGQLTVAQILRQAYQQDPGGRAEPGGMVVLAACVSDMTPADYDEALTLSTSFLAAGAVSVVGSRWEVSGGTTPLLMFMFHHFLAR
jgi:hypothetical protein